MVSVVAVPKLRCPFCNSADITVDPKHPETSYCRCTACGELWHPDRLRPGSTISHR